jgi:HPt (histidine-containing phosphotransfer) domain-containing protein
MKTLIPKLNRTIYIQRRISDFDNCTVALSKNDFTTLANIGHQIKGNAKTFGFEELNTIAHDLELYAHQNDTKQLNIVLENFSEFIQNTKIH